jgi:hypothetical protein
VGVFPFKAATESEVLKELKAKDRELKGRETADF